MHSNPGEIWQSREGEHLRERQKKHLDRVLAQKRYSARGTARILFAGSSARRPALLWGGSGIRAEVVPAVLFVASLFVPVITTLWAGAGTHRSHLMGYLIPVAVVTWYLLNEPIRRAMEIKRRNAVCDSSSVNSDKSDSTSVDGGFAQTVRRALAGAYCIPINLIQLTDTRKSMTRLGGRPLAIEVVALICRDMNLTCEEGQISAAAELMRAEHPQSVQELARQLREHMSKVRIDLGSV